MSSIRKSRAVGAGVRTRAIMRNLGKHGRCDRQRSHRVALQAPADSAPEPVRPTLIAMATGHWRVM